MMMYRFKCCECGKPLEGWYWYRRRGRMDPITYKTTFYIERYCFDCAAGLIDERSCNGLLIAHTDKQEVDNAIHDRRRA